MTTLLAIQVCAAQSEAERLIEAGHWKRARSDAEQRMREHPNDALARYLLSQIRHAFGDTESAFPLAEKAVALDGAVGKYHRQLAEALGVKAQHFGLLQQLVLARRFKKEIDTAIALDSHDAQALRDLMEFYLLAPAIAGGDKSKAAATAEKILQFDPAAGFAAKARLAQFQGDNIRMGELLRKAVEQAPGNYKARIALANFYLSQTPPDLEQAESQGRETVKLDPERVDAYCVLARVFAASGRWAELDALLAASAKEVPDDLAPYYRAASVLLDSDRAPDRAAAYLRRYAAAEPEGNQPRAAEARSKLASIRLDSGPPAAPDVKKTRPY